MIDLYFTGHGQPGGDGLSFFDGSLNYVDLFQTCITEIADL